MASITQLDRRPFAGLADPTVLSGFLGEPPWLAQFRRQAASWARQVLLPDRARHLWRFSNPELFLPQEDPSKVAPVAAPSSWQPEEDLAAAALLAGAAVQVVDLSAEAQRAGVVVAPLAEVAAEPFLGTAVPPSHGFLEALNSAVFRPAVAVVVPRRVRLEKPIRLRLVAGPGLFFPRILLVVHEGASVEVVEGHVGGGPGSLVLGVTEAFVGSGAELRYDVVQRWEGGVTGHLTSRVIMEQDSRAQIALASFGGSVTKVDTGAVLKGRGAEVETFGVALGTANQHFDHHTEHIHHAPQTRSNLDFKVALAGQARSVYTGLIRIEEQAATCEAYQENRNLLLSEEARAETIPELEILNEDVRCTHGATVAPLDEEQVFYLKSRGLPHHQAMRLIVYGFLDQTLSRLPEKTRERIEALVAGRLHGEVL
ncbi:MAG: Fe-S cluster assembly protein SufD [Thermoanaerobaculum sp.]|nr:Fe-S cluster assembly protein SufD [Thermoanaerobaculum sp.]